MRQVADDRQRGGGRGLAQQRRLRALRERRRARRACFASSALFAVTTGLPAASAARQHRLDRIAARDLDDHVDLGIRDELERVASSRGMPSASGRAASSGSRTAIFGDPEPHARSARRAAACWRSSSSSTPPPTMPQPIMPIRISRSGLRADAVERRAARARSPQEAAGSRSSARELVLIREERIVAVLGVELPQRRRSRRPPGARDRARAGARTGTACRRARRRPATSAVTRASSSRTPPRPKRVRSIASLSNRNVRTGNRAANRWP